MTRRFAPNQPRLAPDRAYTERSYDSGTMAGVMLMRRTCTRCRCSKSMKGGITSPKFICSDCRA